jgi:hypothetical protein
MPLRFNGLIAVTIQLSDIALVSARRNSLTIAFNVAFALWFTAMSYSGSGFYGSLINSTAQDVLGLTLWSIFAAVVIAVARRSMRMATIPWLDLAIFGLSLLASDMFWRLYLSPHAWDAFKFVSVLVDASTPIIGAIGFAALVGELRRVQNDPAR